MTIDEGEARTGVTAIEYVARPPSGWFVLDVMRNHATDPVLFVRSFSHVRQSQRQYHSAVSVNPTPGLNLVWNVLNGVIIASPCRPASPLRVPP
jgi:hypothetical protein